MASDFSGSNIEVRSGTDKWGPFQFDVSGILPEGTNLFDCTVESWQGSTETTSDLIDASSVTTTDTKISVRFQCPKNASGEVIYKGDHTVLFNIELDDTEGALHTLRFEYVEVQGR